MFQLISFYTNICGFYVIFLMRSDVEPPPPQSRNITVTNWKPDLDFLLVICWLISPISHHLRVNHWSLIGPLHKRHHNEEDLTPFESHSYLRLLMGGLLTSFACLLPFSSYSRDSSIWTIYIEMLHSEENTSIPTPDRYFTLLFCWYFSRICNRSRNSRLFTRYWRAQHDLRREMTPSDPRLTNFNKR